MRSGNTYRLWVDLAADHSLVFPAYAQDHALEAGYLRVDGIALMRMEVRLLVTDTTWTPVDESLEDADFAFPGAMSNVQNGFGFVGGGYDEISSIVPQKETIESSPFYDYLDRNDHACPGHCE